MAGSEGDWIEVRGAREHNLRDVSLKELVLFVGARVASLLIEEAILAVFVTALGFNKNAVKLIASILTVIINYFFSKLVIFAKKKKN